MSGIENDILLGPGNVSLDPVLGAYYQDIVPSLVHIRKGIFAKLDENGIPYLEINNQRNYAPVLVIQYGLAHYDLLIKGENNTENSKIVLNTLNWLDLNKDSFKDSIVWRSDENLQYGIPKGWISGMYQGQAISLYLRAYQTFKDIHYLHTAEQIFNSFKYDYSEGGFMRVDERNCLWYEEFPTEKPSYVLNGFVYSILGILDLYRVTGNVLAKKLWDSSVSTLEQNLHRYDVWYWSVYDQMKEQLVSYYYQKNVHIPLMKIMYGLTQKDIFLFYATKWEKNLNKSFHRFVTKIMYRVKPRLKNLINNK